MSQEEELNAYQKGIQEGLKHTLMSPETKEKLNSIEQELKEVKVELAQQDIKAAERAKDIEFIKTTLERIEDTLMKVAEEKDREHIKISERQEKIENRIGRLEIKVAVFSAIGTLVGTILGPIIRDLLTK